MARIELSKKVIKFLQEQTASFQTKTLSALEQIESDPLNNSLDIKKMVNKKNHYRLRIGKFRLLYEWIKEEDILLFYDADSRGDIYKKH